MKFINRIHRFMNGRYGVDELYKFLFTFYIVTFIINIFLKNIFIEYLGVFIVIIIFYRFFSKNISRRKRENQNYLELKTALTKPLKNIKRNLKDKDNVYKKCSKCKATLKLPLPDKRGIKHTKCPKCGKQISFITFKKQKIEVIKTKRKSNKHNKK